MGDRSIAAAYARLGHLHAAGLSGCGGTLATTTLDTPMDAHEDARSLTIAHGAQGVLSRVGAPLVRAKLVMPASAPGYGERARLNAILDRGLDDNVRLMLLSAPPGYGKTLALAGWIESCGHARAWLSLDAADNDLARFARYLVAALQTVRPGAGDATRDLFGPGAPPDPELVGATLLEGLAANDDPFVLVLDDYHVITAEPIHRLVRVLIESGPPFVHMVLLTREDPPLPLARLRAHGRLVELRANDVRCTADEAASYLANAGVALPLPLVERLVDRTEGWIAGLQLAAISLRDHPHPDTMVAAFGGSHRFVFDYLADEVLGGVDDELRAFLIQTSIADRFTMELCRALTGRDDAGLLLERAERANLFLVPLDTERRWYRYHGLFADYLRLHLDDQERRTLQERAAAYFDGVGLASEAIGHALAADAIDMAIDLVECAARPAFEAGELSTLMGWLEALPPERVASSPELTSLTAWARFETGEVAAALDLARRHLAATSVRGTAEGRLLVLQALMATVTGSDAEALAAEGLQLVGDDELFRSRAHQATGLARLARGEYGPAVDALRDGLAAALRAGHPMAVLPAVNALGNALDVAGHRDEAETICRNVLAVHTDAQGRTRPIAWSARVVVGIVRYEANDLAEARRELEGGFEAARALGVGRPMLGWAVSYLALARQATGSPEAALEAVRVSSPEVVSTAGPLPGLGAETEARLFLMRGDVAAAARWADRATPEAPPGSPLLEVLRRSMVVNIARVRLAQGRLAEARDLLGETRQAQEAAGAIAELISIGVLEAAVAVAAGQRAPALRALERSVRLAAPGGYIRRFVDDGRTIAHLLPLVRRLAPAFVDELIAAVSGVAAVPTGGAVVWQDGDGQPVEPLTTREIDVLRLMAQGASNADIAAGLTVSVGTAKWHVGHVLAKLGASSRTQALVRAQQLGLV